MVANPIVASFYRNRLERFRGLKVRLDPFLPVNCMDLLLRAIPYVTFAQVVGFSPKAAADSSLSKDDLPLEDQYNAAIIEVLQRLGYAADSSHNKEVGKVDIFVNIDNRTFGVECIMAKRGPTDHKNHRGRFDTALYAYSNADHKALATIGSSKSRVRERVLKTKADGVEIIGLVPNIIGTCELASLPGYCWLLLFSAEAMLGHNVSPRAVTKGCSRRHSCFVAARLCLTVEASGRSMFTLLNIRLRCSSQAGNACNGYRTSNSCRRWSTAVSPRRSSGRSTNQFEDAWRKACLPCTWICK